MKYRCECGRETDNKQSHNAHQGKCKVHLGDRWEKSYKESLSSINKAREISINNKLIAKNEKLIKWISEEHRCEQCNKIMTELYGSGRFCCRSCSNKWVSLNQSEESKNLKILKGTETLISSNKKKSEISKLRRQNKLDVWISEKHKCLHCGSIMTVPYGSGKYCSKECSVAENRYPKRHNSRSFPEKFWESILIKNNIPYKFNHIVRHSDIKSLGNTYYVLDFYLYDKNIDLEIDGSQHKHQKDYDDIRNHELTDSGFIVYRIPWISLNNEKNKQLTSNMINKFLDFYNSI